MTAKDELLRKIESREAVVAVFGLGYVGLPLALTFAEGGFAVIGFDTDPDKVDRINAGESYIERIEHARVRRAVDAHGLRASGDYAQCAQADALIICVPTPLGKHNEPDLRYVIATVDGIVAHLSRGDSRGILVSLESTTYPGTTEEEVRPRIEAAGFRVGDDAFLVYSPEREDPGNPDFDARNTPKVCGGSSDDCLALGVALYGSVVARVVEVSSTRAAEMTKLLENIYRAVNIGLVNELQIIADSMGLDVHEIIAAAATKPFGFTAFYPGPGLGGHCLPIDPFYLSWKAKEYGVSAKFIELAGEVNSAMPKWHAQRAASALNRAGKPLRDAKVLILGVAYKKNVDDMRESPALRIIELLRAEGAVVAYSDPHVPRIGKLRDYDFDLCSEELSEALLAQSDLVMICTDHDRFDYAMIARCSPLLVDTRGVLRRYA